MATLTLPAGMKSKLVGLGGPPFVPSREVRKRGNAKLSSDSSRAIRAVSGNSCSSSGCLSLSKKAIVVPFVNSRGTRRVLVGSARASSLDDSEPSCAPFTQSVDGLLSLESEQSSLGRNTSSAIYSFTDEQDISVALEESLESIISDIARPQPVVQAFSESTFVTDFLTTAGSTGAVAGGSSDVESMVVTMPMYQPKLIWFAQSAEEENILIDRAINATIVVAAGTVAFTKLLTVDHDYWHGWTLLEILKYAPVHNWFAYEELLKTHPVLAKMMISGTVYSLGDWIAQCYEGKPVLEFNRLRMLRSGAVGFCLHGSLSHFYYYFCEWLFPFQGWWVIPLKVGFDQTLWSGFWNSIYFVTIGLLRFESPVSIFKELRETFFPLLTAGWKLWPFAHLITYGVIPVEQRLLWVDIVEIVWVTILAMYSNEKSEARIAEAESIEAIKESVVEAATSATSIDDVMADEMSS